MASAFILGVVPSRTRKPMLQKNPDKNELKGKLPTRKRYRNCTKQTTDQIPRPLTSYGHELEITSITASLKVLTCTAAVRRAYTRKASITCASEHKLWSLPHITYNPSDVMDEIARINRSKWLERDKKACSICSDRHWHEHLP